MIRWLVRDRSRSVRVDPNDVSLFIFINRRRDRMKLLHFADGDSSLSYQLFEAGTFETKRHQG